MNIASATDTSIIMSMDITTTMNTAVTTAAMTDMSAVMEAATADTLLSDVKASRE